LVRFSNISIGTVRGIGEKPPVSGSLS